MSTTTQPLTPQLTLPQICQHLLTNPTFLTTLRCKLTTIPEPTPSPLFATLEQYNNIIDQLSDVIGLLIRRKMELEFEGLLRDNNAILEEVRRSVVGRGRSGDTSFTDIHNLITQQKKRMQQHLDTESLTLHDKSLSLNDDFQQKLTDLQRKVKGMQQKYETNFKSLWNVLSMTESAVFDFIKESKSKEREKENGGGGGVVGHGEGRREEGRKDGLFSFWR